ncbi:hypothetical protein TNCV_108991 [Trichonephila clavipes]|nr:hypothetical protein TNCV_108991 [Trichonephila clavipes]
MKSEHRRFVLLEIFLSPAVEAKEKENRFEQTSRTLQRKISMRSTKDQLVKKDVLMPVKQCVFLWNLPDVEEILLWSPWKYRCGRTVRMAVMACSQKQRSLPRRRIEMKLNSWTLEQKKREKQERRTPERCATGVTF